MNGHLIPFQIETQRVVQLLSKQIYQSPFALLRENTQNAFDAVQERLHKNPSFNPLIEITLTNDKIVIADNGIGMTLMISRNITGQQGAVVKTQTLPVRRESSGRSALELWQISASRTGLLWRQKVW